MIINQYMTISRHNIAEFISQRTPFILSYNYTNHEIEQEIINQLIVYLKYLDRMFIKDMLAYSIRELCTNASKAIFKRIYFLKSGLDINNQKSYDKGMKNFKSDLMKNYNYYVKDKNIKNFEVSVHFLVNNSNFIVKVINNMPPTDSEKQHINNKLKKATNITSLADTFKDVMNQAEGAGFGILSAILMLRNIGIYKKELSFSYENNSTIAEIKIPLLLTKINQKPGIVDSIVKEIDNIPQFPDHIQHLQRLFKVPEVDLDQITQEIKKDPAFSSDLFRLVNSAAFIRFDKIGNLQEAIKIVGLKMLENVLYSYATKHILDNNFKHKRIESVWKHSNRVACYSYFLGKNKNIKNLKTLDDIYTCGLIHDIGKIILWGQNENIQKKIDEICSEKQIPSIVIDDINPGYNHSVIGSLLARKWYFPEMFCQVIANHHNPSESDEPYQEMTAIVYLADCLDNYESTMQYTDIDSNILAGFQIGSEKQFCQLLRQLKKDCQIC